MMMMKSSLVTSARIGGWLARLILMLFIALAIYLWLDVLVFQPEEYERLIGGEAGCGKFRSYCSWSAYVLDQVPLTILAILSMTALLLRRLPRRELILAVLVVLNLAYFGWRVHRTQVEASVSEYCCQYRQPVRVMWQLEHNRQS
jgi:hypothetical protein